MEPQVIDTASHILRSQLRLSKSELLCFRNPLGLQYLASFVRPPFQQQIINLTCCAFPVKASKLSQPASSAPSVILRLLPRGKPSGEGSEKLCRRSVKRKCEIHLYALYPRHRKTWTSKREHWNWKRSACPCTNTLLRLQTASVRSHGTDLPRRHVVDARGIQTVVDGGRES